MCIPEVGSFRLQKNMYACMCPLPAAFFLAKQGVAVGADWRATTLAERAGFQLLLKEWHPWSHQQKGSEAGSLRWQRRQVAVSPC